MQEDFELLQSNDVVEIKESENKAIEDLINAMDISYLFKVGNLIESLADPKNLLKEGIPCRVMTTRQKGWLSGKVKLGLHFIADEIQKEKDDNQNSISSNSKSNSLLDEIRNNIAPTDES
jgi:hypothetical protein